MIIGVLLVTVTTCEAVEESPAASVTVQVIVVSLSGKVEGASLVILATEQLSVVTGVPRATPVAPHIPKELPIVIAAGVVIVGGSLSVIVTLNTQVALLPLVLLVAVMVTVVSHLLKEEPLPVPLPFAVVAPVKE